MTKDDITPFSFDLLFEEDSLTGASAHIVLHTCSKDEAGTTFLTPDCKSAEELHGQINRLQSELEILRNCGIRRFIESINRSKRKRRKR